MVDTCKMDRDSYTSPRSTEDIKISPVGSHESGSDTVKVRHESNSSLDGHRESKVHVEPDILVQDTLVQVEPDTLVQVRPDALVQDGRTL